MELLVHEPATIAFPPPAEGFRRQGAWVRGPWRLWVDARAIDPRMHVVTYELLVWRARAGEPPTLLRRGSRVRHPRLLLGEAGDALSTLDRETTYHPVDAPPRPLPAPDDGWCLPVAAFADCALVRAGTRDRPQRLMLYRFGDGSLRELESHDPGPGHLDPLREIDPVRGGRWLCWLGRGADGRVRTVRVLDLDAGDGARDLCAVARVEREGELALDGVRGDWLLAHSGARVRLFALGDGREHVLHAPHEVEAVHPRRVLCRRTEVRWRQSLRLVLWDPLRPTDRRDVWLPAGEGEPYRGDERVVVEHDRFLVAGRRGLEAVPVDAPGGPAPAALRQQVEPCWEALGRQRGALLGKRPRHGEEAGTAWRAANDALSRVVEVGWLLGTEHVELLESLGQAPDPNVGAQAAWHLGRFGGEAARGALLRMLASRLDSFVQWAVLESLATTGGPEDAAAVMARFPADPWVERCARVLGSLGDPAAIPWLEARREVDLPLRESVEAARAAVDEALARLRDRPAALAAWRSLAGGAP